MESNKKWDGFQTPPNHLHFHAKKLFDEGGKIRDGAIAYLEPRGGGPVADHTHAHDHLFVVLEGAACIRMDGKEIRLEKEKSFLVDGRKPHSVWNALETTTVMLGISVEKPEETKQVRKGCIPMKNYKITVLKGDGIGPEIVDQAKKVLDQAAKKFGFSVTYDRALLGGEAIDATGCPLPQETIDKCKAADAVLLGAVGGPKWDTLPGNQRPEAGLLGIRSALGLFANLRPAVIFEPLKDASPIKPEIIGDSLDIMVVRELTGGIYFGQRGRDTVDGAESAYDTERYSVPEVERIARIAFDMASKRGGKLCSVDKANVLESSRLWRATVARIGEEYPNVELSNMYVDNCAMQLVRNPKQFDVLLTSNMFGDILSDEASMISGSIGMLASASLGQDQFGLYEPIHGSAPDIAGTGMANPLATILSIGMMLKYTLNEPAAAQAVDQAVAKALTKARTADIYEEGMQKVTCEEMGDLVCELL